MTSTPTDPATFLDGYDCGHAVATNDAYRQGHIDGYGLGYAQGLEAARAHQQAIDDEWFTQQNRKLVKFLTAVPPYADLAELRGQHDRAERQLQILRERGIV